MRWWMLPFVAVYWALAFLIWLVVAILLGTAALSVEAVRWLYAHTQRTAR